MRLLQFSPRLPAEIERDERERVARRKPAMALVSTQRPDPKMFEWRSLAELWERGQ